MENRTGREEKITIYGALQRLVMFRSLREDPLLKSIAEALEGLLNGSSDRLDVLDGLNGEINSLLQTATSLSFTENLWQAYLTMLLIRSENPLSLTIEMREAEQAAGGSAEAFARNDMKWIRALFLYDFAREERCLEVPLFSTLTHYHAVAKREQMYNRRASGTIHMLQNELLQAAELPEDNAADAMWKVLSVFYRTRGVGQFSLNSAFRVENAADGSIYFSPISNLQDIHLDDLVGYESQKRQLRENTEAFVDGRRANNCLLFGDSGTGKSTSIKALISEYQDRGLRMIELYKHQCRSLSEVIGRVKNRNYKFIIYMDDLSFEEDETEYKYLKAVIEGGLETRPQNVLIYATSNRRHLIRETWNDTHDLQMDKHHSDTVQEKLSLVQRFGITIGYVRPNQKDYYQIVKELAARHPEISLSEEELLREAAAWEVSHGGMTGRTAQQLIDHLL